MTRGKRVNPTVLPSSHVQGRRRPLRASLPGFDLNALRAALDAMPAVAWVTDLDLRVVHAFGRGLRAAGAAPDRMIGKPLAKAFGCEEIDDIVRGTSAALTGEYRQFECVWANRMYDAEVRPISDSHGTITGAFGIALDVTERNESVDRLRRLTALIDASDDAIVAVGADGRVKSWNRGAEQLFAYPAGTVIGQTLADLFAEREEVETDVKHVLTGEHVAPRDVVRTPHSDDRPRYVSATLAPIKSGAGRTIGISAVIRDQTSVDALETQSFQAENQEAVGRLSNGVAREFDNLLTVLQVYGELLRSQLPEHWPAQEDLKVIMKATWAAADLTRQLLAVSRRRPRAAKPDDAENSKDRA